MDTRMKTTPQRSLRRRRPGKDCIMTMTTTKTKTTTKTDMAVAVYDLHTQAETAVKALQRAGRGLDGSRHSQGLRAALRDGAQGRQVHAGRARGRVGHHARSRIAEDFR